VIGGKKISYEIYKKKKSTVSVMFTLEIGGIGGLCGLAASFLGTLATG